MADISKITLPSGTTYDIKDEVARQMAAGGVSFTIARDASTTPYGVTWEKSGQTITGTLVASEDTQGVFYLVPMSRTGDKDVYAEYVTIVDGSGSGMTYSWEKIGNTDVDLSDLGDLAYKDAASGSYTPAGTIAVNASSGSGTSYTPEGTVAAPTISVSSAGSTTTIKNPTKATVATAVTTAAPGATAPSNAITYYSVANETLKLYQIGYNTGDSITTTNVTVKTGDASYTASAPSFTGTAKKLAFTGTQATITVE